MTELYGCQINKSCLLNVRQREKMNYICSSRYSGLQVLNYQAVTIMKGKPLNITDDKIVLLRQMKDCYDRCFNMTDDQSVLL